MSLRTEVTNRAVDLAEDVWMILDNTLDDLVYSDAGSNKVFLHAESGGLFEITITEVFDD